MQIRIARGIALVGMLAALGACGGGGDGGGGNNPARTIAMANPSGNAQTDTIGAPLTNPIRVEVEEDGILKQGVTVAWSVQSGGGQVAPATSVTDVNGLATTNWTLGDNLGAQTARATVTGAGGSPVTFTATAGAGNPAVLTLNAGDNQSAILNAGVATPLSVKVSDRLNNGVSGVTVDWAVGSGTLLLDAATSSSNLQGIASMQVSTGATGGAATVDGSSVGVPGLITFDVTVINASRQVNIGAGVIFRSARNNSQNPAVDTVQAGQSVFWLSAGGTHTVASTGVPSFTSSGNLSGAGANYLLAFPTAGTYQYECGVHGSAMTGRIVVQ